MSSRPRASTATEGTRKPLRRSGTPFDRRTTFGGKGGTNPFQLGADVLRLNVDAVVTIYKETIDVAKKMMQSGAASQLLGLFGTGIYIDLLHGGAYATDVASLPYYNTNSKYNPVGPGGDWKLLQNLPQKGLADYGLSLLFGTGIDPTNLLLEPVVNGNVPHIFPKILSDQMYGVLRAGMVYTAGTDNFKTGSQGLSTLVNAESNLIRATGEAVEDIGGAIPKGVGGLQALMSLLSAGA